MSSFKTLSGIPEELFLEFMKEALVPVETLIDRVSNLANISAFLFDWLDSVNWVGFYLYEDGKLKLGPFQGEPACQAIENGRGVCGRALMEKRYFNVPDVSLFPGHIACSDKSKSELVYPILREDMSVIGVIDIDSPILSRFSEDDVRLLQRVSEIVKSFF